MTKKLFKIFTAIGLGIALSACSSSPKVDHYAMIYKNTGKDTGITQIKTRNRTLIVAEIKADSVLDDQFMYYQRELGKIEQFSRSQWLTNPSRMLQPIFVSALESSNAFKAVIPLPANAMGDYRADITLTKLMLNYIQGSNTSTQEKIVELGFRVRLINVDTDKLIYSRVYATEINIHEDTPVAGVSALNNALKELIPKIVNDITK